jgi:release factor glutamine methyltransferase
VTAAARDDIPRVTARLRAAGCVFAEDEARLLVAAAETPAALDALMSRRVAGHPLEHVLGWAEFCGLRLAVSDGVFVPRRRSEFLVRQAIMVARTRQPGGLRGPAGLRGPGGHRRAVRTIVVDLCCGSGAVGVAVAAALVEVDLYAADIEPAAVACARRNVGSVGGRVYQGDLYDPLPARLRGRVDVLVVNAPYVPTAEIALMPAEARLYEPAIALDGGGDGVDVHRRVAASAPDWISPGGRGHLLIETSARQAAETARAMRANGLVTTLASDDELDATVVVGTLPATVEQPG